MKFVETDNETIFSNDLSFISLVLKIRQRQQNALYDKGNIEK